MFYPFKEKNTKRIIGKNVNISFHEKSLIRLKEHNPECKLTLIIREPVARAYSAYTMAVKDGWMHKDFNEIVTIIDKRNYQDIMYGHFVGHGFYAKQIEMVLKYFKPSDLKIFLYDDLKQH